MSMKIINDENIKAINDLNSALSELNFKGKIRVKEIESREEIGVLVELPPMYSITAQPCIVSIKNRYKETKLSFSEVLEDINNEIADLISTVKPDYLKAARIDNSFGLNDIDKFSIIISIRKENENNNRYGA